MYFLFPTHMLLEIVQEPKSAISEELTLATFYTGHYQCLVDKQVEKVQ